MKKTKNIIIFILIMLMVGGVILNQRVSDLDELWNYNFARNIADGKLPYKDFNMIQTPLLPLIASVFLKIIANELLVMRILAIILCSLIFFMIYKILERLEINSYMSLLFTVGIGFLFKDHLRIDYNLAIILIILFIIYIELKNKSKDIININKKKDILIGILAGTTILFKQTTGLFLTVIAICYPILFIKEKQEVKVFLKSALFRFFGAAIPVVLLIIYILAFNIWNDFISYTFEGIKTFSNFIFYTELLKNEKWIIKILAVILPINIIIQFIFGIAKNNNSKLNKNIAILFVYSIASLITILPISDEIHFLIGMLPNIIALAYFINLIINKITKNKIKIFIKYFITCLTTGMIIFASFKSILSLIEYLKNANQYTELEHFKYIPISDGLKNQIIILDEYIKKDEKKIYILDATACAYIIPINICNKNYDMFLVGNLGKDGEDGIIKEISSMKDVKLLIIKDGYNRNWQNPEKVREYIKSNLNKTGDILLFDIYEL